MTLARRCKCQITKEFGNTDIFIKIDGKYYKSQEIYDNHKKEQELRKEIIDIVLYDFLHYQQGQVFPTILTKKLKELDFYPNEVILKTIEVNSDNIRYWMDNKEFDSDYGKIAYMFAIIKNTINDVHRDWKREKRIKREEKKSSIDINIDIQDINTAQVGKDISNWLEDDEL